MIDPLVARAIVASIVAIADEELTQTEMEKAAVIMVTRAGYEQAQQAVEAAAQMVAEHGKDAAGLAIQSLTEHHPSREERIEIVRECIAIAGADGLSPGESRMITSLMAVWGLREADV
jgi:uncharacterized tellurite resistance protein B-like protein